MTGNRLINKIIRSAIPTILVGPLLVACEAGSPPESTAIRFDETAAEVGLTRSGPSYAAAAADFDRDGWPDLAVSEHRRVKLYRNEQGTGFAALGEDRFRQRRDTHGLTWLHWNADGWPDLYVSRGAFRGRGERSNALHINRQGERFEPTDTAGVLANARGRGRSATPWDLNGDGRLDLMILNFLDVDRPQRLAMSGPAGYRDAAPELGWDRLEADTVTAFGFRNETAFVLHGNGAHAGHVFRRDGAGGFVDVTGELGITLDHETTVSAVAVGDMDNDGDDDLYYVLAPADHQGARQADGFVEFFYADRLGADRPGFRVRAEGAFTLDVWAEGRRRHDHLHLGGGARVADDSELEVAPQDASLAGKPDLEGARPGVYFWRQSPGIYALRYVGGDGRPGAVTGRLTSVSGNVALVDQYGERFLDVQAPNRLYVNEGDHFRRLDVAADAAGGTDAHLADFDNDGDLDLFVVNGADKLDNPPDRLYENRGGLDFVDVTDLAGIAGSREGRGGSATLLDYDRDGRLDVFVGNGHGPAPRNRDGPQQFFRNGSTAGNWLRVRLEPTVSNAMALGTTVVVQAGELSQRRFVTAATGALSTSWLPLHFGLGGAEEVTVSVAWPTGRIQRTRARANETITLAEPAAEGDDP